MRKTVALFAISSLLACRNTGKQNQAHDSIQVMNEAGPAVDTLSYAYDSVKVYSKTKTLQHEQGADTAKATFIFPVFQNEKLNALIREQALLTNNPDSRKYTSYEDLANSFINEFDAFIKDNPDSPQRWFRDVVIKVLPQRKNYLGISYSYADYAGGAHGYAAVYYKNYTVNDLKLLTLNDLIVEGKRPELDSIAEELFRKSEKIGAKQSLKEGYFFDKGIFTLNENWTLTDHGLEFIYNPYEIKAYAYGSTKLIIPYATIKHILKPNSFVPVQK